MKVNLSFCKRGKFTKQIFFYSFWERKMSLIELTFEWETKCDGNAREKGRSSIVDRECL